MSDYKSTLNLPQTEFAMQAKLAQREPERLQQWQAQGLYQQVQQATSGRPAFWLVDGPPYANGDIHIGHAVNKVLKDIIVKSRRLDGYQAAYVPGWDCHGLPIELQVEKKHGKVGKKLDAAEFRAACREYASSQVERQRVDFERLGVLGDWDNPYLTMKPAFEAEQIRALGKIIANGHVVRGYKPVHWCLDCGSSLAEAEVEYQDKTSPAIDVKFPAADPADLAKRFGVASADNAHFVIWTTTPWTLPANQAIAVHAELQYALVRCGEELLVLAEELVEAVCERLGQTGEVLATATGEVLAGAQAQHPFLERVVPILTGEHVTLETGTGLVHTAPAHGLEDFDVGKREGLPMDNPVASNGCFVEATPHVGGTYVRKAEATILELLEQRGMLAHHREIRHSYPHCWRHKTPLIFRATPQWFISMDAEGLRAKALEEIAKTQWFPAWGERRIQEMVAGRPDWCISRQRTWGVPMAVFMHRETGELHPQMPALIEKIADKVAADGLEAWFGSQVSDWLDGDDAEQYEMAQDTLDVWFDSGVVHQCSFVSTVPEAMTDGIAPIGDFYLEGSDQHRGWFQSSLLTSCAMHGRAPYKSVLTHGFTVDEQGRKMSKSVGNVVAPQTVMNELGADVLRLWVAASDYRGEIAVSKELLKRIADAYRRIRNTTRFLLGNLHGFDPEQHLVPVEEMLVLDRWAVAEAAKLQARIQEAYLECEFHQVYQRLHNYCVVDLGGLYLDILKDRLYTTAADSRARRSAQSAMYHIAEALVRWIAPVLSFTADEIWQELPGDRSGSVFAQTWYSLPAADAAGELDWARLKAVREPVKKYLESLRKAEQLGGSLEAELDLYADGDLQAALQAPGEELRFWLLTSEARVQSLTDAPVAAERVTLESGEVLALSARRSAHGKCERCWHRRSDVGANANHPGICGRCVDNIDGAGEARRYV